LTQDCVEYHSPHYEKGNHFCDYCRSCRWCDCGFWSVHRKSITQEKRARLDKKNRSRLPPQNTELTIISPEENAFTDQEQIVVAGKSVPLADVLLLVNEEEYLTTTDDQGNFSFEVTLLGGSNALSIYVTLQDGKQIMETRMVVFSTADFDAEEATSSAKTGKTATTSGTPSKAGTP